MMNQDFNNLNQNNLNIQGNNGIPNNQPLNNIYGQIPQQPINQQNVQTNNSFNQPQQPMQQPIQNNVSINIQPSNNKPKKKLGLIIGIVVAIVIVITSLFFFLNKDNKSNSKESNNEVKNLSWISIDDIKHYPTYALAPTNLSEIDIERPIIKFKNEDNEMIMDFTKGDYFPYEISNPGLDLSTYKWIDVGAVNHALDETKTIKTDEYDSLLASGDSTIGCIESDIYYTCYFTINNSLIAMGINTESTTIEEAKKSIKDRLKMIIHDDSNSISVEEFQDSILHQVKFNLSKLDIKNEKVESYLTFSNADGKIRANKLGVSYYYSKIIIDDVKFILFANPKSVDYESYKVAEINDSIRLYKNESEFCNYDSFKHQLSFEFIAGIVEDESEYLLKLQVTLPVEKYLNCNEDEIKEYYEIGEKKIVNALLKKFK